MTDTVDVRALTANPAALLVRLLRFDTRNPPGAEGELITFLAGLFTAVGLAPQLLAAEPGRPNLVVRVPGRGHGPPLLLHGHVDVVGVENEVWAHGPFDGHVDANGMVWGRGALDMKGGVAMLVAAVLRCALDDPPPRSDVVLAVMVDEERRSHAGARFLVENHARLFADVRFAIGEFGGFTQTIAGRRFAPIQVSEKRRCTVRMTAHGPGGHGALGVPGAAVPRLARALARLDRRGLPVRVEPVTRRTVEAIADRLPAPAAAGMRGLLIPPLTRPLLRALGTGGHSLAPLLADTAVPTTLRAGEPQNVIPNRASAVLDGRVLPGTDTATFLAQLRTVTGLQDLEVLDEDPPVSAVNWGMYRELAELLHDADPSATPIPMLLAGVTDGRFFARLGIQHYGFLPMSLPADMILPTLIHAANERVPATAITFGADLLTRLLRGA